MKNNAFHINKGVVFISSVINQISVFLLLVIFVLVQSCTKEDISVGELPFQEGEEFILYKDNVVLLDHESINTLIPRAENQFSFQTVEDETILNEGDIMIINPNDSIVFPVEIIKKEHDGDEITYTIKPINILDAFDSFNFDIELDKDQLELRMDCDAEISQEIESCQSDICFKLKEFNPKLNFSQSPGGSPKLIYDIGDVIFETDIYLDCPTLQIEDARVNVLAVKDFIKNVKNLFKNGLKAIEISPDGSIGIKGASDPDNSLVSLDDLFENFDFGIGFYIKDAIWEGDLKYHQNLELGVKDFELSIQLNTSLTDAITNFELVTIDADLDFHALSSGFNNVEFGCNGKAQTGFFMELSISSDNKEYSKGILTVNYEQKLLEFKVDSGVLLEAENQSDSPLIKFSVSTASIGSAEFFGLEDFSTDFINPRSAEIFSTEVDLECTGILTNVDYEYIPPGDTDGSLSLSIDGEQDQSFNLYYIINNEAQFVESYNYGTSVNQSLNANINSLRIEDVIRPKCAVDIPLIPNGGDPETSDGICLKNIIDSRDGELYCTLKVCEDNNSATNCKTWLRRNLRYNSGDSPYPNNNSDFWRLGRLYSWEEVSNSNICPNGYRVATFNDYEHLETAIRNNNQESIADNELAYFINASYAWQSANGNDGEVYSKFFELLPNGYLSIWDDQFQEMGSSANLWTLEPLEGSDNISVYSVNVDSGNLFYRPVIKDAFKLGVRCVCDQNCD